MAGIYGDKAGWLKKKKPGKPWDTHFCVVRGDTFEVYKDDRIKDVKPRQTFSLRGVRLEPKVPSTLLEGSLDAHHGTDKYSFMVTPRADPRGKKAERHVFKAMHDEEKTAWLRALQQANGSRGSGARAVIGTPTPEVDDAFETEDVVSRLETYACLVSFRVQRYFIHLLNSPHEDYRTFKSVGQAILMAQAVTGLSTPLQHSASERHLAEQLALLDASGSSSEDEYPETAPRVPTSDGSDDDAPPVPTTKKLTQASARQKAAGIGGFSQSTASGSGLKAPPPLPQHSAGGRSRAVAKSPPMPAGVPPSPAPPLPPTMPPAAPPIGNLSTDSGSRFDDEQRQAQLQHRKTVTRMVGHSITGARAQLARESSKASSAADAPVASGRGHSARRRMSALLQQKDGLHRKSKHAYEEGWPFLTGWMLKKGRKRTNWKQRWFVLAGPFLLYYDSPESQVAHDVLDDNFLFLKGFRLITNRELRAGSCEIRSYESQQVQRTVVNHPDCFVLQDESRELFLDPPPQSARSHSTAEWVRRLRRGIQTAAEVETLDEGVQTLLAQGSGLAPQSATPAMIVSDACLPRVFRETLPRDQQAMLAAMDHQWEALPPTMSTLQRSGRYLQRCSLVLYDNHGVPEPCGMFLFNDIFVYATMDRNAAGVAIFTYVGHHSLTDLTLIEPSESELHTETQISLKVTPQHALTQEATDDDMYAEFRQSNIIRFTCGHLENSSDPEVLCLIWQTELLGAIKHAKQPSNKMERFEGAVIFADVSGFSNLGDYLERRERAAKAGQSSEARALGETAAEGLAKFLGNEVEKMVEMVTKGGGDVIKFAGDCVIAVFQAEDYVELEKDLDYAYSALALATGQAIRVSVEMTNRQRDVVARASERHFEDEISELVAKLNIHVAIGAGMVYGYHVGGVAGKWEYLIDGPVMGQVRSADEDAGAGEVALSAEAHELVNKIDMRKKKLPSGNFLLMTYLGPTTVPKFIRPWETVQGEQKRELLADQLMQYVAGPVVEQVQAGLTTVAQHRMISTAFCRLIGIDYESHEGEMAVVELGAITSQVQLILNKHNGTLTRVISDDKGTSMLLAFDHANEAVLAALEMIGSITSIPVAEGQPTFKTAIGITTGTVWIGCVGGRIRSEYTMHGSHVNFAARLMTCPLIKYDGGVLCDRATRDACDGIAFTETEAMPFKGFKEKLVSYVPHAPGADTRSLADKLQHKLAVHNQRVSDWEGQLDLILGRHDQVSTKKEKGPGVVVVVQTDFAGHWQLDPLLEAIENSNRRARLDPMERCHVPIAPELDSEIDREHDDDDHIVLRRKETIARHQRNNKQLTSLLGTPGSLRNMLYVIERADALSAEGWALLHKLCKSKQHLRQEEAHSIIVITLDPAPQGTGPAYTGAEALEDSNRRAVHKTAPQKWSSLDFITYSQLPWFDTPSAEPVPKPKPESRVDEAPGKPPATPQAGGRAPPALPSTLSRTSTTSLARQRTRSAVVVGADRIFTLQVCAVLASHTAMELHEPHLEKAMLRELHPMLLNKKWGWDYQDGVGYGSRTIVVEHIEFLVKNNDPDTDEPYLRTEGERLVFPSVESHRLRYNQMIFDQRAMTHKNLVKWYKLKRKDTEAQTGEASAADSAASIATISAIAHHAEAGGMDTIAEQYKALAKIEQEKLARSGERGI